MKDNECDSKIVTGFGEPHWCKLRKGHKGKHRCGVIWGLKHKHIQCDWTWGDKEDKEHTQAMKEKAKQINS